MTISDNDFIALRKEIIKKDFSRMNSMQLQAVVTAKGPLLVLAGAGSGKTTVLVNRIASLIKYGEAFNSSYVPTIVSDSDIEAGKAFLSGKTNEIPQNVFSSYPAKPWEILAITFTNKAASELKERIAAKLGDEANDIWAGTFHSVCGRILRRYADMLGYASHFTIYDTDDQKNVIKQVLKALDISDKELPPKFCLNEISHAKDKLLTPEGYAAQVTANPMKKAVVNVFNEYQKALKKADAMDFDDMIVNTVRLFQQNSDVLEYYQNKFKYIMVDEYQDTNHAQYKLVSLLADKYKNICVVGDDDQSIYSFRGATIENILNFEDEYENAKVIRLEQNYRSTSTILDAANAVISNNKGRKGKNLWTDKNSNSKIEVRTLSTEREEAFFVADTILENVRNGGKFSDNAVLYRMNAISSTVENIFVRSGIPYRVIGGLRFFDRKEIRDVIAYLNVINNKNDNVRLRRIINEPKRGIGLTTVNNAAEIAESIGVSLFEVLSQSENYPALSRASQKLNQFTCMINELEKLSETLSIDELLKNVLEKSGYLNALKAEGNEARDRVENVNELSSSIINYQNESENPSLSEYLEQVALISDIDAYNAGADSVILMTIHSAKGLEFSNVFIVGMEEGVFPGTQSIYAGDAEIEEERRLAYVGITRAKLRLYISNTYMRMLFGMTSRNLPSRFLKEIPDELCNCVGTGFESTASVGSNYGYSGGYSSLYSGGYSNGEYGKTTTARKSDSTVIIQKRNNEPKTVYSKGMSVKHKVFGKGIILSCQPMGGDNLLEVAFDNVGTKKLMANFVKMEIL